MAAVMTEATLKERLQARPDSLAFSRLADLYRKSGNIAQAIDLCVNGVEKHPEYVTGRIILGRCYLEQENLDKAVESFVGVCRVDERNIVALKMLADIFMRQGHHEKAGDLFLILAGIDPYNEMLARSAAQTRGSGKRDIRDILGITVDRKREYAASAPPSEPRAADTISAPAGTQIATPQELGITQSAPPFAAMADSKAATELATEIDLDEVLAEATEITGSDITERMTNMFGGEEATVAEPVAGTPPAPEHAPEPEAKPLGIMPVEETIEVEPLTEVPDGTTLTARIDELFGKDTIKMPAIKEVPREPSAAKAGETIEELSPPGEAAFEETMIMDADVMKLREESGISIKQEPGLNTEQEEKSKEHLVIEELVNGGMVESIENAAGNLVVDEQDTVEDLFKSIEDLNDKALSKSFSEEQEPAVADLIVSRETDSGFNADDTISGDDVQRRLEQMLEGKSPMPAGRGADSDKPGFDDTISGDDVRTRLEQMLEGKSPMPTGRGADSDKPGLDDTISGDDVRNRIEQMLEKKSPQSAESSRQMDVDTPASYNLFEAPEEKTEVTPEPPDDLEAAVAELVIDDADTSTASAVSGSPAATSDVFERSEEIFEKNRGKEEIPVAAPKPARTAAMDETSASSKLTVAEDTISGTDVVERLQAIFEKKEGKEDILAVPEVSLGRPGHPGIDTETEATVVFEQDEKSVVCRSEPPVDREALSEASFEIRKPGAAGDETSALSKPGTAADSITGDDVAKRLEGMFEKKTISDNREPPPTPSESTGTATEAIEDTSLSSDSVIETVGIMTGSDVEERLNDMFMEAPSTPQELEALLPAPPQPIEKEEVFQPVEQIIEEFEETLISGDSKPLVPGDAAKETAPAFPAERDESVDDESSALGELEEMFEADSQESGSLDPDAAVTPFEAIETGREQTAVFEDFEPGSIPKAPPPAPDVPLFLTGKDTPVDSETILAEVGKNDSPYDLPDHVLTPTLADLYFQQGQPHLALSIYRRLLEKSGGENDKFKKRIGDIEKAVADGTAVTRSPDDPPVVPVAKHKKITPAAGLHATSRTKKSLGVNRENLRPLSGVRLKKRPKIQWRKKSGEK
jgi:hypothetical protein